MDNRDVPREDRGDMDLTAAVTIISIAVVGGILALPYSVTLALVVCFGLLIAYALWFAILPEIARHRAARHYRHLLHR